MLPRLIAFVLATAFIALAQAQAPGDGHQKKPIVYTPTVPFTTGWEASKKGDYNPLDVVRISEPGVRHPCRIPVFTADSLICKGGFRRKEVSYARNDVAALILPPYHGERNRFIASWIFSGVCIAGSFFAPTIAVAILLRVAAGAPLAFVGFELLFGSSMSEDGNDHDADWLFYQSPGTSLTVTLH